MKNIGVTNKKDILLLLLHSPGVKNTFNEPLAGRTKLIKALFLFNKEVWKKFKENIKLEQDQLYAFFPWNYGPFSKEVYDDINFFVLRDFIQVKISTNETIIEEAAEWNFWIKSTGIEGESNEFQEELFCLTEKGANFTTDLYKTLSDNQRFILREFKSRIQELPLRALLRYVYTTYPDQIEKSIIADEILD